MTGATIPEGSVVITPTEMYREMIATHQAVRDVAAKLDSTQGDNSRRIEGLEKDHIDHETRIRSVERRVWQVGGAATALSGGAAALISQLMNKH